MDNYFRGSLNHIAKRYVNNAGKLAINRPWKAPLKTEAYLVIAPWTCLHNTNELQFPDESMHLID